MRVFISQPMQGKTVEEIEKERQKAYSEACLITGEKLQLIEQRIMNVTLNDVRSFDKPLKALEYALFQLADADVA